MIVNEPSIAGYVCNRGVRRIFVDLETLGKQARQGHLDTWISPHSPSDIIKLRQTVKPGHLLVRLNPFNHDTPAEVEFAIKAGADWLMLPMFRSLEEIHHFSSLVNSRVPIIPLVETSDAFNLLPQLVGQPSLSDIYIGLNDLRIDCGFKFLFEPLINGMLDDAAEILNAHSIPWGFGGVGRIGQGQLPAELILGEHTRLGSSHVILSRSFHQNKSSLQSFQQQFDFDAEFQKIASVEARWNISTEEQLSLNHQHVIDIVRNIMADV